MRRVMENGAVVAAESNRRTRSLNPVEQSVGGMIGLAVDEPYQQANSQAKSDGNPAVP